MVSVWGCFKRALFSKFHFLVVHGDAEIALLGSLSQIPALLSVHCLMSDRSKLSHLQSGGYTEILGACRGFDPQHRLLLLWLMSFSLPAGDLARVISTHSCRDQSIRPPASVTIQRL